MTIDKVLGYMKIFFWSFVLAYLGSWIPAALGYELATYALLTAATLHAGIALVFFAIYNLMKTYHV